MSEIQFGKRYRRKASAWNDLEGWMTPTEITDEPMRPLRLRYDSGAFLSATVEWFLGNYELDEPTPDPVNHPAHYKAGDIECIDAIKSALGKEGFIDYCIGNAVKYSWRWRRKNGVEDLRKATWYLAKAIDVVAESQSQTE